MRELHAPFVWFGGKRTVANIVWESLGDVENYVEPFFGSGAVLLARPHSPKCETVNDADGLLANFWRAVSHDPEAVAEHAANPVNEADLHARHLWLVNAKNGITERLMADAGWFDAKAAGWWVWGVNCWIGSGFCSGNGPWVSVDGIFTKRGTGQGVNRKLPHLGNTGGGVNRQLPHLGGTGRGVNRKLTQGNRKSFLQDWFADLKSRLHETRVACGDWERVCGPSVLRSAGGITGIFFDPPYDLNMRTAVYANESGCAKDVLAWCVKHGGERDLRVVLAGYDGEHNHLTEHGWRVHAWKASGGFGLQGDGTGKENAAKERLWFSPHCLDYERQGSLL
jgi:DNA adenine methylase